MSKSDDILLEEAFEQKPMTRSTFLRLFAWVGPYRRTFVLNLVFTLLATISSLIGPKLIQVGMDAYLGPGLPAQTAVGGIAIMSGIYLGNLLIGWFFSAAQVRTAITVGQGAMNDLRIAVFTHIQRLSLSYFDKTHQGRIINRADTDIDSLDRVMTWGANQLLANVLMFFGVIVLMLQYD